MMHLLSFAAVFRCVIMNATAFQVSTSEVTRCLAGSKLPFVVVILDVQVSSAGVNT